MHLSLKPIDRIMIKTVFAISIVLLMMVSPCYAGIMLDRVVAVVNNEAITWSELYKAMAIELKKRFGPVSIEQKMTVLRNNESSFLENMIDKSLLLQEAQRKGLSVRPEEVNMAIQNIRQEHFVSEEALINTVNEEGYTFEEYRTRVSEKILTNRLMQLEVLEKIKVSEDDISKYLKENGLQNRTQYKIRQIFIGNTQDQGSAEQKMEELQRRMASGEDFGELAMAYSEGPAREQGGYLGYVSPGQLSREFQDAFNDMYPGDVALLKSGGGLHLIELLEIRDVQEALKEALFEDRYGKWLKALRDNAYIEIKL
jgi:peptidyl-prolyl cis-trans isomerase SurA